MATTPTKLMTFAEFERLPDPPSGHYELLNGELVLVPPPKYTHFMMLQKLRKLLQKAAGDAGEVFTEVPIKPRSEYEWFQVDVAHAPLERWAAPGSDDYFPGAPDLVIEVLSPSNRPGKMGHKKKTCLDTGSREFWVVNMEHRTVEVSTADGLSVTYKSGLEIPIFFSPGAHLAINAIFAD